MSDSRTYLRRTLESSSTPSTPPVVPVGGCMNPAATNFNPAANFDDGSCTFSSTNVVFDTANQKAIQTQIGANIIETDIAKIPTLQAAAVSLNLQAYYYFTLHSDPNEMDAATALIVNNFVTACGADLGVYYPVAKISTPPFTKLDWLISTFSPVFVQLDQECQTASGASTYISRANGAIAHIAGTKTVYDTALVYRTNSVSVNWNVSLSGESATNLGRQYIQISDICSFTTDMDANLVLLNNYFDNLLPLYLTQFLSRLPNLDKEVISQWHTEDTGHDFISSKPLGNWAIGKTVEHILANTERYEYLFWMTIGNLIKKGVPQPEYYAIKRNVPLFRATHYIPVTIPLDGCSGGGFLNGVNSYSLLVNNQSASSHTIPAASIVIPTKTVSGNFTRNTGWATSWNAANQLENSIVESSISIKPYSSSVVTFSTV